MAPPFRNVKGTRDLLPPETALWAAVEGTARRVMKAYGFAEIRTPILEETELFVRSVGETTDIVGKEMYTFQDRKGRSLTLRPEGTAPVVRAYIERRLGERPGSVRLYYIGPYFRYERPQRGRYRQFHQIGAEILGEPGPEADLELLLMLHRLLRELEFEDVEVRLSTLGDESSRAAFAEALREYLEPRADRLGEESRRRLEKNPLRILDTKHPEERQLLAEAPEMSRFLTAASRAHFERVLAGLERLGISHRIDPRLVRGLDYYTHTVFEIAAAGLGAQDAIVGGGRYDRLVADLGGEPVPALGFAIGLDRLLEVLPEAFRHRQRAAPPALVVAAGEVEPMEAVALAEELRDGGVAAIAELSGRSLKAALRAASRQELTTVVILGDEEARRGEVTVRDLRRGEQRSVSRAGLAATLGGSEG